MFIAGLATLYKLTVRLLLFLSLFLRLLIVSLFPPPLSLSRRSHREQIFIFQFVDSGDGSDTEWCQRQQEESGGR